MPYRHLPVTEPPHTTVSSSPYSWYFIKQHHVIRSDNWSANAVILNYDEFALFSDPKNGILAHVIEECLVSTD